MLKKRSRKRRAGQADQWTGEWFNGHCLHACVAPSVTRRQRSHVSKIVVKPCASKSHARIERGMGKWVCHADTTPLTTNGYRFEE